MKQAFRVVATLPLALALVGSLGTAGCAIGTTSEEGAAEQTRSASSQTPAAEAPPPEAAEVNPAKPSGPSSAAGSVAPAVKPLSQVIPVPLPWNQVPLTDPSTTGGNGASK